MAFSSLLFGRFRLKFPPFSITMKTHLSTSSNARIIIAHLQKHDENLEKNLTFIKPQLDAPCVAQVLTNCCTNKPLLGLRFFIWAGVQSKYRHSQYMYSLACKLLNIQKYPCRIMDLFEAYRMVGFATNVKHFKVVLNLCKEAKMADEALWVLRKMEEFNCRPDLNVFNVVIRLFCEEGNLKMASGLMEEMEMGDLYPDMITFTTMLKGFCNVGRLEDAYRLFKKMGCHHGTSYLVAYSMLLDGICRFGGYDKALDLLREMEKQGGECMPNVITYTSVIQRFCEKGKSVEALSILKRMEDCGCYPNRVTVSVLMKGLCDEGHISEAYELVDSVVTKGYVSNSDCYSSLVISLLRVKRLEEAEKHFKWMLDNDVRPDGLACSMLLKGLCLKEKFLDAFYLYEKVEKSGCVLTMDTDIFSMLLVGLCQHIHKAEFAKLASSMIEKRIQIEKPYVDTMSEFIKGYSDMKSLVELCNSKDRLLK